MEQWELKRVGGLVRIRSAGLWGKPPGHNILGNEATIDLESSTQYRGVVSKDKKHFTSYREQTRVKHEILAKYLAAYLHILKRNNKNLVYFDGFAGPGVYQDEGLEHDGSPMRALKLIASNPDFSKRVSTFFCESDPELYNSLEARLKSFYEANPSIREPQSANLMFAKGLELVLQHVKKEGKTLAPTFLFVDPCGVGGVTHELLVRLMKNKHCELFIFFNIDGVKRILGLAKLGPTLAEVFGSATEAENAKSKLAVCRSSADKERVLISYYCNLIKRTIGTEFVTPFRVEHKTRRLVSHYFIHVTRSALGFRIMKSVMWGLGRTESGRRGLALTQASASQPTLIDLTWKSLVESIFEELHVPRTAQYFYVKLSEQPGNFYCDKAYREALLKLEENGNVEVRDKNGKITSAATRRKRNGEPTLSAPHTIQLVKKS